MEKLRKKPVDGLHEIVILSLVNPTAQSETVWFTTKGQVVIPLRLRRMFHIEDGTRVIVTATEEGILLKPVTAATIERGFGLLKRKPGEKTLAEEWAEHKREEREKEEAKYDRHGSR
jgi:AbrB family looped-hinge helix DNA binding protein